MSFHNRARWTSRFQHSKAINDALWFLPIAHYLHSPHHTMPLPPYLSSAASSRAHHALLVKTDGAASLHAEDAVLAAEVERCRGVLASGPSSVSFPSFGTSSTYPIAVPSPPNGSPS